MTDREFLSARVFARLASIPVPGEEPPLADTFTFSRLGYREWERGWEQQMRNYIPPAPRAADRREQQSRLREWAGFRGSLSDSEFAALLRDFSSVSSIVRALHRAVKGHRVERLIEHHAIARLARLHYQARTIMVSLFQVGRAQVPAVETPPMVLELKGRSILRREYPGEDSYETLADFLPLFSLRPCPFGRCPHCRSFFVRRGRQKFCSKSCRLLATEAGRRGKRREYMRRYMAERRARSRGSG
jgi:hypothetical protein